MAHFGYSPDDFAMPAFSNAVQLAVDAGLVAAAVLDAGGRVLAVAGLIEEDEARTMVAHATHRDDASELLERMRNGQLIKAPVDDRDAGIGIAANRLFFLVVFPRELRAWPRPVVAELRADLEHALQRANTRLLLPPTNAGGTPSGPAELPVIELGVTVGRRDRN